jgi:LacI family transcriptional regulator
MARPTLKDIADRAGVSMTTVSRALQNKSDISLPTIERIRKLADEFGYVHNSVAKSLRSQETRIVGLVVADSSNPFYGPVIKGAEATLAQNGYSVILCDTDESYQREKDAIDVLLGHRVDGLLITPAQSENNDISALIAKGVPFVLVGRSFKDFEVDCVVCDDRRGASAATEHLLRLGHSNILLLNAPGYISSAADRRSGYEEALRARGLEVDGRLIYESDPTTESAYNTVKRALVEGVVFSALFAFNDIMLIGALQALKEHGAKVPSEVSMVGFDDLEFLSLLDPPMTSVRIQRYQMGVESANLLLSRIKGRTEAQKIILPAELIIRGSTARMN